jgi:adenylate kinase family enzyme
MCFSFRRDTERDASAIQCCKANQDVVMRKVLVIGSGGAGKSTFAAKLSRRTGLPLIHLDSLYWRPGWIETSAAEWDQTIEHLLGRDTWIMDGNYGRTLERRLAACDTVIFLDLPRLLCLQRIIRRRLQFHGRSRPDMREGCPERLSWEYIQWVWAYPERHRPGILARLAALEPEKQIVVLRSTGEVERFLALPTGCA